MKIIGTNNFINFESFDEELINQSRKMKTLTNFYVDLCELNNSSVVLYINLFKNMNYSCFCQVLTLKNDNFDNLCDFLNFEHLWNSLCCKLYMDGFGDDYCMLGDDFY